MASILKHLRSSTADKRPTGSGLSDGQLAINTASGTPGVFVKDSAGNVVKIGPAHVGTAAPNAVPAGSAGNSRGEMWVDEATTTPGLKYYNGASFINLTPSGTTTTVGLVELATPAETQAGTDGVRAVTPSGLQSKISDSISTTSSTTIASATAVKTAYDLANAALPETGGTITGELLISPSGSLVFEGSVDDSFETTIAVVNPTADRTITFPDITGTVITSADTGTVTGTMIANGTITNDDINASAAIVDTKLATISTAGKVSNSATTATSANTASAIVARDGSGNFAAGTITAALTGNASTATALSSARTFALTGNVTGSVSSDLTSGASISATIASGVVTSAMIVDGTIVNADINASAAIAGTKISPDFGSQTVTTTGLFSHALGTAGAPTITFTGDTNTGIYSPGADQVAISTNGTGRLFVDANGNVGLVSAPSAFGTRTAIQLNGAVNNWFAGGVNGLTLFSRNLYNDGGNKFIGSSYASNYYQNTSGEHVFEYSSASGTAGAAATMLEAMRITNAGRLGLGTSSPAARLDVNGTVRLSGGEDNQIEWVNNGQQWRINNSTAGRFYLYDVTNTKFPFGVDANTPSDTLVVKSTGRVGIGTTSPSQLLHAQVSSANTVFLGSHNNTGVDFYANDSTGEARLTAKRLGGTGGKFLSFYTDTGSAEFERARIDSSGRLLVGTSSSLSAGNWSDSLIQVRGNSSGSTFEAKLALFTGKTIASGIGAGESLGRVAFGNGEGGEAAWITAQADAGWSASDYPGRLVFSTTADGASSPTERMRITQAGDIHTAGRTSSTLSTVGCTLEVSGAIWGVRSGGTVGVFNRRANDGNLIEFYQDDTIEGSISVSGTTVSYNGAHLSRWSQLPGGATREEILRGTVLSNIDEMCAWGEEANEQLNRMKVSDVEGDPNVAGVFQAWDDDDDTYTDDFYCAMTGDFIIRIAEGVTVQRGDLLMSAGDGTAKPQDDDIVRSKTIAKVTSHHITCTYDDGSYCVPCVLMAC